MFIFRIHDAIWLLVLQICGLKLLGMVLFVILCISAFLMVMYNCNKEELKKNLLYDDWSCKNISTTKNPPSVGEKLEDLAANLSKKEHTLKESQFQIASAEKFLHRIETVSHDSVRERYISLLRDLKNDLRKTENEVRTLQSEVTSLSKRRENLKNELLNQQLDYQNMLDAFGKELGGKNQLSHARGY